MDQHQHPSVLLETSVKANESLLKILKYPRSAHFLMKHVVGPMLIDHTPKWANTSRTAVLKLGAGYVDYRALEAIRWCLVAAQKGYVAGLDAFKTGKPIAWTDWMIPCDIVRAFGYDVYCPTTAFAASAAQGPDGGARYSAITEEAGVSDVLCSVDKAGLGSYLAGDLPHPSLVVNGTHPCDSARMQCMVLEYHTPDVPTFTMDTPYGRSDYELDRWVKSAWELIDFIEKNTGRNLDWAKLEESARYVHRYTVAINEAAELHRANPAPPLMGMLNLLWRTRLTEAGREELAISAEKIRDATHWYVEQNARKKAPKDKLRVLFGDQGVVWTDFQAWMYKHYGARVVADYIGRAYYPPVDFSSKESIIKTLVIEKLYLSMIRQSHGTMELNIGETESLMEEYAVDCVLFNNNAGCKHNLALKKILSDTCSRAGIPALFMDLDIVDNRYLSEREIQARIANFFTTYGLA